MSFVTTPSSSSPPSARQSAATSELLPEPTGPPIPTRSARSGGKEPPFAGRVRERAQLQRGCEAGRQLARIVRRGCCLVREAVEERCRLDEPARGRRRVDRQEPDCGGGDRRRVLVEVRLRQLEVIEARLGGDDPERDSAWRRLARPAVAVDQLVPPDGRGASQELRAQPAGGRAEWWAGAAGLGFAVE